MLTKDEILDKFHYQDYMKNVGVTYFTDTQIYFQKKAFPFVTYNKKSDVFVLHFNGPDGFGPQTLYIDYFDFCSACEDAKGNFLKPKSERQSVMENLFGSSWVDNPKLAAIGLVLFCFNLTPSLLRKVKSNRKKLTLQPKLLHCKLLPQLLPLPYLNAYMKGFYNPRFLPK